MNNLNESILNQYSASNLFEAIKSTLLQMKKNLDELTIKDLAPVDFFHIRGYYSTRELAEKCEILPHVRVLDVGCGIGGTARLLTTLYGCFVTGIDIIDEYCQTAVKLSSILKLNDRTEFKTFNGSEFPFDDEMFDVVWTEHVQMNIENKNKFYSEIYRVLKNNGKFVFHDVFQGNCDMVYYPVPWADDESISYLLSKNETEQILKLFDLKISFIEDKTEISAEAFQKSVENIKRKGLPPLGLHLLMGENTVDKIENMARNLAENRITVLQCICVK
jgi:ubiquinone/menaquinone biosynthesis C-methylase UbiE